MMKRTLPWVRCLCATSAALIAACSPSRTGTPVASVAPAAGSGQRNQPNLDDMVCVVQGDSLRMVPVTRSTNGDSLVDGVPFRNAYPATYPPYVAAAPWYVAGEFVRFGQRVYGRNDVPQQISPELLRFTGRYRGVPVFRAADEELTPPSMIYLPLRPGCVFQPLSAVSGHVEPG
jgi:hypothetical protein